jgi:hypothetical protein
MVARTRTNVISTLCLVSSFFVRLFAFLLLLLFTLLPLFFFVYFSFIMRLFLFPLCSILFLVLLIFSLMLLLFPFLPCLCSLYFFLLLQILHICPHNYLITVGGACIMYGYRRCALIFWYKDLMEDLGVDGRIILK